LSQEESVKQPNQTISSNVEEEKQTDEDQTNMDMRDAKDGNDMSNAHDSFLECVQCYIWPKLVVAEKANPKEFAIRVDLVAPVVPG